MELGLRLFGSAARSRTLLAIALLEQSYPREIARVAGVPLMSVQRIVDDLQRQGAVSSRLRGTQREVRLNPSYFGFKQLRALLLRLAPSEPKIVEVVESLRRRPRRAAKGI
ncbi:MAG TPA: hypothetical protein VME66_01910 [Candidatus Acidoferrales bacterium]|nr:hypothetical protein [Candidatus Acidoferrales bacterium]